MCSLSSFADAFSLLICLFILASVCLDDASRFRFHIFFCLSSLSFPSFLLSLTHSLSLAQSSPQNVLRSCCLFLYKKSLWLFSSSSSHSLSLSLSLSSLSACVYEHKIQKGTGRFTRGPDTRVKVKRSREEAKVLRRRSERMQSSSSFSTFLSFPFSPSISPFIPLFSLSVSSYSCSEF